MENETTAERTGEQDEWYVALAMSVCEEHGWPFLLPVTIKRRWLLDRYEIRTGADGIGCNVVIQVNPQREILRVSFLPR